MRDLSWTPRRKGKIYCSPACGHGCSWAQHETAVAAASELAEQLGDGWEPRVWENMGWCYEARSPHLRVYPNITSHGYMALLCREPDGDDGHWTAFGTTSHEALRRVLAEARAESRAMRSLLQLIDPS